MNVAIKYEIESITRDRAPEQKIYISVSVMSVENFMLLIFFTC